MSSGGIKELLCALGAAKRKRPCAVVLGLSWNRLQNSKLTSHGSQRVKDEVLKPGSFLQYIYIYMSPYSPRLLCVGWRNELVRTMSSTWPRPAQCMPVAASHTGDLGVQATRTPAPLMSTNPRSFVQAINKREMMICLITEVMAV